jgi:hypothetical protein
VKRCETILERKKNYKRMLRYSNDKFIYENESAYMIMSDVFEES